MFLIRGDGNARIGVGHLMRCMTIAEELAALQGSRDKICFVCADEESGAFVRENGFRSYVLGTDYRDMESELPRWMSVWEGLQTDNISSAADVESNPVYTVNTGEGAASSDSSVVILVDSYYVTDSYLAALRERAYTILMDDMGLHRYPVDCVINYNAPADPEAYQKLYQGSGTRLLIGSRYAPLRRQFRETHARSWQSAGTDIVEVLGQNTEKGMAEALGQSTETGIAEVLGQSTETGIAEVLGQSTETGMVEVLEQSTETGVAEVLEQSAESGSTGNPKQQFGINGTEAVEGQTGTADPEYLGQRRNPDISAQETAVREILITTGGGDSGNIAGEVLKRIYSDDYSFHLVMGRFHPHFQEMQELEKQHENIHIHHDVKDMAGLMCRCQIAVTAGGSTIYELAALGIPFICFSYAENQEALVEYIGDKGIAGSAGAWHKDPDLTLDHIGKLFRELVCRQGLRSRYRKNEIGMIDGKGAGRLALAILEAEAY